MFDVVKVVLFQSKHIRFQMSFNRDNDILSVDEYIYKKEISSITPLFVSPKEVQTYKLFVFRLVYCL